MHPKTLKICALVSKAMEYSPTALTLERMVGPQIDAIINPAKPETEKPIADAGPETPPAAATFLLAAKDEYKEVTGKKPGPKWDIATIKERQAAFVADNK